MTLKAKKDIGEAFALVLYRSASFFSFDDVVTGENEEKVKWCGIVLNDIMVE